MMEWLDINECTPEHQEIFLACDAINEFVSLAIMDYEEDILSWMYVCPIDKDLWVTHWMPLPELPKEK